MVATAMRSPARTAFQLGRAKSMAGRGYLLEILFAISRARAPERRRFDNRPRKLQIMLGGVAEGQLEMSETGERLAALETALKELKDTRFASLEASFKEFKDSLGKITDQRFTDLRSALSDRLSDVRGVISSLDTLIWRAILGGIAAVVSLWTGFAVLYKEIDGLDKRVANFETQLANITKAAEALPAGITGLKEASNAIKGNAEALQGATTSLHDAARTLAAEIKNMPRPAPIIGEAPGTLNIPLFDERQLSLIRSTLPKVAGVAVTSLADKLALGEFAKDPELLRAFVQTPQELIKEVPQLEGTKFAIGERHILIARSADDRVVAVIPL
jgi:predicted  nucleic acid-binding Zn-ribbon protein